MELEVGMYVRTKRGIKQLYKIDNNKTKYKYLYKLKKQDGDGCIDCGVLSDEDILKASNNIIDLIEVGDYVNGSKLLSIDYAEDRDGNCDKLHFYYSFENDEKDVNEYYEELNIKSIVTKEQFSSMEYRLGE